MSLLIISDSFKGSLSSIEVGKTVKDAVFEWGYNGEVSAISVGDGGEGTSQSLMAFCSHEVFVENFTNAYQGESNVKIYVSAGVLYLDVAEVVGLANVPIEERMPLKSSSEGIGEVIAFAQERGLQKIVICCGGSATVDGGMGLLVALGVRFLDENGKQLSGIASNLSRIVDFDLSHLKTSLEIEVLVDVNNPLLGEYGAAKCFGPQKGAILADVEKLESGLENFAKVTKRKLGDFVEAGSFGMGAAGGLPFALKYFLGAKTVSGFNYFSEFIGLENRVKKADLIITGEGKLDAQSFMGKVVGELNQLARKFNKVVVVITGVIDVSSEQLSERGVKYAYSILRNNSVDELMGDKELTKSNLAAIAREVIPPILDGFS